MKTALKRMVSILICLSMVISLGTVGFAAKNKSESIPVSCVEDLKDLKKDVPVILVTGLQGEYYKGLSTETEDDDVRIWGPDVGVILKEVFANLGDIIRCLIFDDYSELSLILGDVAYAMFSDFTCDEKGIPNPDTGKKDKSTDELKKENGYENWYDFMYDWRLDVRTTAKQLDEYIDYIMELTGSDKVALAAMSMGNSVTMTFLYDYYFTVKNYAKRNRIDSVVFIAGAMNGVATCEDPFSGNMSIDSVTFMRFLKEVMNGNAGTKALYYALEMLYEIGTIDCIADYVNNLTNEVLKNGFNDAAVDVVGTIPGFYALMSAERYEETRAYLFNTPEKREKYSAIIESGDYYHYKVQKNNKEIIKSLLANGVNTAIIAEYGYTVMPLTSDNDRMSDGTILTSAESFGATCAEVDGTLGENYKQAKECKCKKNHVSADNQIDASTCAFADITWFVKYMKHSADDKLLSDLINLIIYSDKQITVWSYSEYPQFLINPDNEKLVPLTAENAGKVISYEEATVMGEFKAKLNLLFKK